MKDFEIISHTADLKIRVYGETLPTFFRNAVIGMFQSIGPHAKGCSYNNERLVCPSLPVHHTVHITSFDLNALVVDFLSEALYFSDTYNEAYLDATIQSVDEKNYAIDAVLHGVAVERFDVVEIKAVTFHDLDLRCIQGIWQADIVFDI